jgi:hypothetical protein
LALPAVLISTFAVELIRDVRIKDALALTAYELALVLPVIVILMSRKAGWKSLAFRSFTVDNLALGCGLLIATYVAIIIHNSILLALGVPTRADSMRKLLEMAGSPWGIALGGVIVAPLVEEIVFRGFFFQGLRQAYGSKKAILVSSLFCRHARNGRFPPSSRLHPGLCVRQGGFDLARSLAAPAGEFARYRHRNVDVQLPRRCLDREPGRFAQSRVIRRTWFS